VRSQNFVTVSNAGEAQARRAALDFERVRGIFSRVLADAAFDVRQPVVALAVANEQGLRDVLPQFFERRSQRPVAAYWSGPFEHHIVLRVDARPHERYRRILHEYAHLLTYVNVPDAPAWLDEGVSELWGSTVVRDDGVGVGATLPHHVRLLRKERRWIPLQELIAMDRAPDPRDARRVALFYAQSWALAHYLFLERASDALELVPSVYVRSLRDRASRLEAAESAFGPLPELERALRAYVHHRAFRSRRIEMPGFGPGTDADGTADVRVRPLSEAEALIVRARFLVDGERSDAALPLLKEAMRLDPHRTSAFETLGRLYFRQNKPADAIGWFDRAIASGSASYLAHYYRALLDARRSEHDLQRAIALNPRFAPAYARLADLYATDAARPLDALPLLRRATELEPASAAHWIRLGHLLLLVDRPEEARAAAKQGLAHARATAARELAEALLLDIDRRATLP
jgi:tetratricopeptide (TPR) repeat protein